jgi:hypothetical protein
MVPQIHSGKRIKDKEYEMFTTELQTGTIKAIGSVEFDDMDNAIVSIKVDGQVLTETEVSSKEFEVLQRYFSEVTK